jgi:hypothetical protein
MMFACVAIDWMHSFSPQLRRPLRAPISLPLMTNLLLIRSKTLLKEKGDPEHEKEQGTKRRGVCTIHRSMHASAWGIDRAIN